MQKHLWRLIDTGVGTGAWNMAVDAALLEFFHETARPVLRLYGWEDSVSLGRFQKSGEALDMARMETAGLPYVRRMTGGGALVHGGDLSYSLVFPREMLEGMGVKASYRYLCGFLIALYGRLGLRAEFACEAGREENRSPVCLAGTEAYDILIDGKKMGGNAQRYTKKGVLMHGSIPMQIDTERFDKIFRSDSGLGRAASLESLGVGVEYGKLAALAAESFRESFGVRTSPGELSDGEKTRAAELMRTQYATKESR